MNIIIVEDEVLLANRLERLCRKIVGDKLSSLKLFSNLGEADDYVSCHIIDLMFLDLNLQGQDGFELLKQNMAGSFHTIVVSAYTNRAIEAFEFGVLDFVAKPFTEKRLQQAFDRMDSSEITGKHSTTKYLSVHRQGAIEIVDIADINYIQGAGNYSELHLKGGETRLHNKSLSQLVNILPLNFNRLHRSFIVPMESVASLGAVSSSDHCAELKDGTQIPISRNKYKELKQL